VPSAALAAVAQRVRPVVRDAAQPASLKGALGKVLDGPFAEQRALRAAAMRAESRLAPAAQRAAVVPAASEMDHRPEVPQLVQAVRHGVVAPVAPEAAVTALKPPQAVLCVVAGQAGRPAALRPAERLRREICQERPPRVEEHDYRRLARKSSVRAAAARLALF